MTSVLPYAELHAARRIIDAARLSSPRAAPAIAGSSASTVGASPLIPPDGVERPEEEEMPLILTPIDGPDEMSMAQLTYSAPGEMNLIMYFNEVEDPPPSTVRAHENTVHSGDCFNIIRGTKT